MQQSREITDQSILIEQLQNQIRRAETTRRVDDGTCISSGCEAINRMLPAGGYLPGAIVQWLTHGGQGVDFLSLLAAKNACEQGGALVVFDPHNRFYPPAAAAIGINLGNLIILRADEASNSNHSPHDSQSNLLWAIDQALRCPAVAAVWGAIDSIGEKWFRRFQLSAETSGCLGLFIQPLRQSRQPSWAEVQWTVGPSSKQSRPQASSSSPEHSLQAGRELRLSLKLTRCRNTHTGKSIVLSINTITGNVRQLRFGS